MPPPDAAPEALRCFVTAVTLVKPDVSRFHAVVHFEQDHGRGDVKLRGSFETTTGHYYKVGDVIWATVTS